MINDEGKHMNILLLHDQKSIENNAIHDLVLKMLTQEGHNVESIKLNFNEIKACVGCFACWIKTPGQCAITGDEANRLAAKQIRADVIVLVSEIKYGGFSSDIKAFLDRAIQNILPHFVIYKGEMHHPMRYEKFPIWIAIGYGDVSDGEKQTFIRLADRNALNKRPLRHLAITVRDCTELTNKKQVILDVLEARV